MEQLHIARNLFDLGIVIVVWLAQAIMYPSFEHIEENVFVAWHQNIHQAYSFLRDSIAVRTGNHCWDSGLLRCFLPYHAFSRTDFHVLGFHIWSFRSVPCPTSTRRQGSARHTEACLDEPDKNHAMDCGSFDRHLAALSSVNPARRSRPDGSSRTEATVRISKIFLVREHNSAMERKRVEPGPGQESVWDYPRPPRIEDTSKGIRVIFNNVCVAQSTRAKRVLETSHPPVYYIPPQDVAHEYSTSNRTDIVLRMERSGNLLYGRNRWALCGQRRLVLSSAFT